MHPILLIAALVSLLAWLYLCLFHGRFWSSLPVLPAATPSGSASVAVVIPARDEAESIVAALRSLLAQQYSGPLHIILVDDNSTDGTGELAAALDHHGRLSILNGEPLPAGWSGKLWAVHQGLAHPAAQRADYVLLSDADIVHAPDHLARLVAHAEPGRLELVSEMVRLNCQTLAERATIPAFIFFFQMLYPFAWVADRSKKMAGAAGGTMLVARGALERIDGVRGIRSALIDDCALAHAIKSTGGSIWLGHAEETRSLRVYARWSEIWNMVARTAYVQLDHSPLMLAGCVAGMLILYCLPPILSFYALGATQLIALAAWLLMGASFQPTLRRYGRSSLWGFALPAIALFYLGATIASAVRHHAGRGGGWKNRVYPKTDS